jgi:2'-5' RNA ligase
VPRENYHVTIAFVGDVPRTQMRGLEQIGCAQQPMRCALKFDAFEYWPKPQVAVAAAREISPELEHFWQALHRDLALLSLALEPKRLRPHLTLARHVPHSPEPGAAPSLLWSPREFSLVHSDTSGSQSVYTVVDTWPLLDTASSG